MKIFKILSAVIFSLNISFSSYALETVEGKCSWYGPGFHTRTTANGEKYDMYGVSAAHRTLAFGTLVRVTHLKNKRSTVIRVNDRGPVPKSVYMDLSYAAAKGLNMINEGRAKVKFEIVGNKKGMFTKDESFFVNLDVRLESKKEYEKINSNLAKLYTVGIKNASSLLQEIDNGLCLGPFEEFMEAEKIFFKIATLYPHATIWLKDNSKMKKAEKQN